MQKVRAATLAMLLVMSAWPVVAQGNAITLSLNDASQIQPRNVTVEAVRYGGSEALRVRQTGPYRGFDTDTFAFVPGLDFHDGTIEVDVAGSSLPDAPPNARGFVGIAFRIDAEAEALHPRGSIFGRATGPRRRPGPPQTVQPSISPTPGYDFDRLRREAPGQYESYTDLVVGEWTHLRIEVSARPPDFMSAALPSPRSSCAI